MVKKKGENDMFTLRSLLAVLERDTLVEVLSALTGEIFAEGVADDLEMVTIDGAQIYDFTAAELKDDVVMDINIRNNIMVIYIDHE